MPASKKVIVHCAAGCKAEGHPERGVHSHFCDSEARWKLSMRLRTQELRTIAARRAAEQIGDRLQTKIGKLREAILVAPHASGCIFVRSGARSCDCWRMQALEVANGR